MVSDFSKAIIAVAIFLSLVSAASAQVETDRGKVLGVQANGLTVYKGIPFAAPPVGDLRWRPPQQAKPWNGVLLADTFAPACIQSGVSMPGETPPAVSEDCLYLNIWTPTKRPSVPLPVMVWIYGGGFTTGSAAMPLYWGDRLAHKGVICVTFGYRVGPLGFLVHPELTRESPHHSSGNYGFMDQVAALEWVQRNISAFGGDPKRVTIAGQSAGATSVCVLMCSPLAKGLFHQAIEQSGGLLEPVQLAPRVLLANAEHEGESYAKSLGVHSIAELRALPAKDLLKGEWGNVSHVVIEPYLLPDSPYNLFIANQQNNVPILIGSNADEYRSMIEHPEEIKASTFLTDIAKSWGPLPPLLLSAYPYTTDAEARTARLALERDLRFGWDMWALARLASSLGHSSVYYYHFTHNPPFPEGSVKAGWGASHYAELWYMFDHLDQENWHWTSADRKLAKTMSTYWANFVKSGDPNGRGLPQWPKFTPTVARVLYLDDHIRSDTVADLKTLQVVDTVYTQVRGSAFGQSTKQ
jgi:para-nitrobenzyl esterase